MANPQTEMILCQQTFITKGIFQKGCYTQLTILSQFKALKFINLTCYGWSSPSHTLLLGASTHWITEHFKYWGILLSLKTINRPHMGLNLSHHNNEMLKSFNIVDKIYCMTAWLPKTPQTASQWDFPSKTNFLNSTPENIFLSVWCIHQHDQAVWHQENCCKSGRPYSEISTYLPFTSCWPITSWQLCTILFQVQGCLRNVDKSGQLTEAEVKWLTIKSQSNTRFPWLKEYQP